MGGLTALLIHLPAQWLAQALFKATQGQVQLQEAKGSVWQGSGKLVLTGGEGSRDALALPGRIHWQTGMSLNSANLPQFNFNLNAPCCMTQSARLSLQAPERLQVWQLQVDDHQSQWPAHLLSGLGAPWNTLEPEGTLRLETKQLRFNLQTQPAWLQGGITLTAENMSSKLSTLKPMGTYQINLGGASEGLNAATGEYEDLVKAGIIDAAKVTRSALQNAASIAALFLTTEAVIADKPEGAGGGMPDMGDF